MKKLILSLIALLVIMVFFSCSDYVGDMPGNIKPKLVIYDTYDNISSNKTRVQWYANDQDGTKIKYSYCITTDTTMTVSEAEMELDAELWSETEDSYVELSMPFAPLNSDIMFVDSTTFIDTVEFVEVTREIVWSRFFLFAEDPEEDGKTAVTSKVFGRTNRIPKFPMLKSEKLGFNGFDDYRFIIGPDSSQMILENETSTWEAIDFTWRGEDDDGYDVVLEFRWELWSIDPHPDSIDVKIDMVASEDWRETPTSVKFSKVLYDYFLTDVTRDRYSFKIWVRDDAREESDEHTTANFYIFTPKLEKGILLVDDTSLRNMGSYLTFEGNPDKNVVKDLYDSLLVNAGFTIDSADPLTDYDYWDVVTDGEPTLKALAEHRLIVIQSEDRKSTINYDSYRRTLEEYINVGGKVFLVGSSNLLAEDLKVDNYKKPIRVVFEDFNDSSQPFNEGTMEFFYTYFGIYSYTHPESKSFWSQSMYESGNLLLIGKIPGNYYYTDNYGFVGAAPVGHITDVNFTDMNIDSTVVNTYWTDASAPLGTTVELTLKKNGNILTGIPSFEAFKGEVVYEFKSVYDYDEHSDIREWTNPNLADSLNLSGPVAQIDGAVLTRYQANDDVYRTAMCTLPLIFMDNSDGSVSNMFKAMIDWFEIDIDPMTK
ncbi:MAG: hypothetical protein PF574_03685 [Candidatus Delongbacteria bacterium]|jgi:hypothetical protein|nr:hypothetical protein [Candidatus Delongbacteria bacterium]